MNRGKFGKWARRVVWGVFAAVAAIGCNPLNVIGFMFARDEKVPAPYPLVFAEDGPKKDKEEVVVLLLPHLAPGTAPQFVTADRDLAEKLFRVLPELAKQNKHKLRVVSPTQVDKFKMANPNWKQLGPEKIGEKLGADFVLEIELSRMRLYQPNTASERIYEGRADVSVAIYEIGAEGGEFKDRYQLAFAYPRGIGMVRSASAMPESEFKKHYLENLAVEIAHQHTDHKASNSIASGR